MLKNRKLLSPLTILMIIIVIAAVITWLIPAGKFDTLNYQDGGFTYVTDSSSRKMEGTQATLDSLKIFIPLASFQNGNIKKPVSIPGTFHHTSSKKQNIINIIEAPIEGAMDSIDIILFLLFIGSFINVFQETGVLARSLANLSRKMKGREASLIIILTFLFSFGGASYGMAEETLAFYPIIVPLFLSAGYDLILPVAVLFAGTQLGTLASFSNPFSTIIASNAAGISWTDGLLERVIIFLITTLVTIIYFVRYAKKVKANPAAGFHQGAESLPFGNTVAEETKTSRKDRILLLVFFLTFFTLIFGVVKLGWWLEEMTALFFAATLLTGFLAKVPESTFVSQFIKGAEGMLGVGLIIATARGVTIILNNGQISDSILFYSSQLVSHLPGPLLIVGIFVLYLILTLFIASSSGMAVLTMPIIGGLGMMANIPGREIVNAYLFGMGIMGFMTPTGLILPSLAMVNVGIKAWWKFIWPLMAILTLIVLTTLIVGIHFK